MISSGEKLSDRIILRRLHFIFGLMVEERGRLESTLILLQQERPPSLLLFSCAIRRSSDNVSLYSGFFLSLADELRLSQALRVLC